MDSNDVRHGLDVAAARRALVAAVDRAPPTATLLRVGLGATILLAGLHKFVAPAAWDAYVVPWLAAIMPISTRAFTLGNGVMEVVVGLLLAADRHTAPLAALTAVSLAATVAYLGLAVVLYGRFGEILVRDLGLLVLASGVTLGALRRA